MEENVKEKKPRKKRSPRSKRNSPIIPQDVLKHATPEEREVIETVAAQFKVLRDILSSEHPLTMLQERYASAREDLENLTGPLYARRQLEK